MSLTLKVTGAEGSVSDDKSMSPSRTVNCRAANGRCRESRVCGGGEGKKIFFREVGVGGEESESYTMGGCEHLRRRQEKLLRRTMTRREIEFYIFGSDQRASAPELSALRSVQENCR
jgi:hypothetical protein